MNKTKLIHVSTQVDVVFEVWLEIVLKINFHGWVAGSIENMAISASNLKLKLKLTEAELGNMENIPNGGRVKKNLIWEI